ncbi:RDD family protein [Rhodopirellula islandica]|uniref:RDD family protein n=1 Tax=Rhodopirellula islandica TaxID=595434 RepID=UPI0021BBFFD1|nr:RDD family protein [Rhodopirellula islandica]
MRRLFAMMVDGAILTLVGIANWILLALLFYVLETNRSPETLHLAIWVTIIWIYMTVIKRSWLRTIGYRLAGLRIVDTRGSRPSLTRMTLRMLMWIFGPFNFILDLIWLGADSEQQSLRDCYCSTYVVLATAQPEGTAPVHLTRYFAAGMAPSYPRVVRPRKVS